MKDPQFGSNKIQSFIDFLTTVGKVRFGTEGLAMFAEVAGTKVWLTDSSGNFIATIAEATAGAGVPIDGVTIKDGTIRPSTALGTTPVATVSIVEIGDGANMLTILTLTDFIIGALAGAGAALGIGNIVYAYPASPGVHVEGPSYQEIALKCAGTPVNADVGLGSVIASGAINLLSGTATFEDRLTGQTIPTAVGGGSLTKALANTTAGVSTGIALNIAGSTKNVFLNAAGTWNANNTGNLTATGMIILKWTKYL